jgi:hypothetical protein
MYQNGKSLNTNIAEKNATCTVCPMHFLQTEVGGRSIIIALHKGKVVPMKTYGEWMYRCIIFLTSALVGGEWPVLRPGHFTPGQEPPVPIG